MVRMTRLHLVLRGAAALSLALGGFGLGTTALGADGPAPVLVGHIDGEINPITARYVDRVVSDGESDNAAAVAFVIDTPGGLIDSTYQITARFLATRVPIVTFVAPAGARAASAGTFITMAATSPRWRRRRISARRTRSIRAAATYKATFASRPRTMRSRISSTSRRREGVTSNGPRTPSARASARAWTKRWP